MRQATPRLHIRLSGCPIPASPLEDVLRTPRIILAVGAATALTLALAAPAYAGTVSAISPTTCFAAQQQLTTDQHQLALDRQADQNEDNSISGGADFTPDSYDTAVTNAQATVNNDQGYVNALCGGNTGNPGGGNGHPHPWPNPGPVGFPGCNGYPYNNTTYTNYYNNNCLPGPAGNPFPLNCSQLAARGIGPNIPQSSQWYRTSLDANGDGIACETNLTVYRTVNNQRCHLVDGSWVPVPVAAPSPCPSSCSASAPPPVIYQAPQTVTAPAPVFTAPAPVYVSPAAPVGPAQTGR